MVVLCAHLDTDDLQELPLHSGEVLDFYDGPTIATISCYRCGCQALASMVDWSTSHRTRLFLLSAIAPEALAQFVAAQTREPSHDQYVEALETLHSASDPPRRLVAYEIYDHRVVASRPFPAGLSRPQGHWSDRFIEQGEPDWFPYLGLSKSSAA